MTNSVIQKIVLFVFFGIVASGCALEDDSTVTAKKDIAKPVLTEITAVSSPTSNTEPSYIFNTTEEGTISYGGSCTSTTSSAVSGDNTITFSSLSDGTYSDCTLTVTDSSGNVSSPLSITSFVVDLIPVIAEVTAVTTPANDTTPNYTFSSSESGTIVYGGSCSSNTTSATSGDNTITFSTLSSGTYSDCTIRVTDSAGKASNSLTITSFVIDATEPTVLSTSPTDRQTGISIGTSISITFSESIDTSSVTTNTSNTDCSGTIQLSSNNFSSCVQISSTPSASNSNKTFSMTPSSYISAGTTFKIKVLNTLKDSVGNTLSSNYTTSNGFTTVSGPILSQVTAVTTPTNNTTPSYTFSSNESGTITYGGSCSSSTTSATTDNNTVSLNSLIDRTYSDCTITVTGSTTNGSSTLNINTFVIDTTAPTVSSVSPTDNQSSASISNNISVTFSEGMDNTTVTTNTDNTSCLGSFLLSSDNFSSCVQMSSSTSSSNSDKTFTVDPSDNLSYSTTYKIRVTTGVKDSAGNTLSSQYTQSGFTLLLYLLPDTGQTDDYTNTFGEDSDYTINPPSFTNNGDGTVTDENTGLMWQRQDDATQRVWSSSVSYCSDLTLAGYSDWRLPEVFELQNIVDYEEIRPTIDTSYFPSTQSNRYWSSTSYVSDSSNAWIVNFESGLVTKYNLSSDEYVRCVRGQVKTFSFTNNGNGTVTDQTTGLHWQQTHDVNTRSWEDALSYCEGAFSGQQQRLADAQHQGITIHLGSQPEHPRHRHHLFPQ